MQPGAEKASFTPVLDSAHSGHIHSKWGQLRHRMQPCSYLRPWVDRVTGAEVHGQAYTFRQADVCTGTQMCPETYNCREVPISTCRGHTCMHLGVQGRQTPCMHMQINACKLQAESHLYTHRHRAGASVSRNADVQRHKYRHMLPCVHPDTARLVNTSVLQTHTRGPVSKCRAPGSRNVCVRNAHMPFPIHCCSQHA